MRVCGVDPGLNTTGYGLIEVSGKLARVIDAGTIQPARVQNLDQRVYEVFADLGELLNEHTIDLLAVEQLYSHYAHPRTAILMGHVRGAILACAAQHDVKVQEYSATQIKRAVTGHGRASKMRVAQAVRHELNIVDLIEPDDVSDALAVALCARYLAKKSRGPEDGRAAQLRIKRS